MCKHKIDYTRCDKSQVLSTKCSVLIGQEIYSLYSENGSHKLRATLYDYTKYDISWVQSAEC